VSLAGCKGCERHVLTADSGSTNNPVLRFLLFVPSAAHRPMRLSVPGMWAILARPSRLTDSRERADEQTPPNRSSYPNTARYRCSTHPHLPIATPHRTTCPFPLSKLHSTCSHSHCTLCSRYRRTHLISLSHYRLPRSCHPRRSLRRYHGGKSNKYGGCVRRRTRKKRVKHCKAS